MKAGRYEKLRPRRDGWHVDAMGLAPGGRMRQEICDDPCGLDAWDQRTAAGARERRPAGRGEGWSAAAGQRDGCGSARRHAREAASGAGTHRRSAGLAVREGAARRRCPSFGCAGTAWLTQARIRPRCRPDNPFQGEGPMHVVNVSRARNGRSRLPARVGAGGDAVVARPVPCRAGIERRPDTLKGKAASPGAPGPAKPAAAPRRPANGIDSPVLKNGVLRAHTLRSCASLR